MFGSRNLNFVPPNNRPLKIRSEIFPDGAVRTVAGLPIPLQFEGSTHTGGSEDTSNAGKDIIEDDGTGYLLYFSEHLPRA